MQANLTQLLAGGEKQQTGFIGYKWHLNTSLCPA
jgi:hypothetical protein